jgi:hypothetical protein
VMTLTGFKWLRRQACGSYEHGNAHFDSIKSGKYLDYLNDYWLPKKDSIHGFS